MILLGSALALALASPVLTQSIRIQSGTVYPPTPQPNGPPLGAIVSTSASETFTATSNNDLYLFSGPAGTDLVKGFADGDRITTTSTLASLAADSSDRFVLPDGGTVRLLYPPGSPISHLQLLGSSKSGATTYYVYARSGDTVATPTLSFATSPPPEISAPATQNGVLYVKENDVVNGATINPIIIHGGLRGFETQQNATISNSVINGLVTTDVARDGIYILKKGNVTISNFSLTHSATKSTGTNLPEGIAILSGTNHLVRDGIVQGFQYSGTGYLNGDGMATEGGTSGQILRVTSRNNQDGGSDIKGDWTGQNLTSENNSRDYRLWTTFTGNNLTANGWTSAAIQINQNAIVTIDQFSATNTNSAPIFLLEGNITLTVRRCTFNVPSGTVVFQSTGSGNNLAGVDASCRNLS